MANICKVQRKSERGRERHAWEVRYRDPQRRDRSKTFRTKAESEAFADAVETDIDRGHYLDPRLGKKSFVEWARQSGRNHRNELGLHRTPAALREPAVRSAPPRKG